MARIEAQRIGVERLDPRARRDRELAVRRVEDDAARAVAERVVEVVGASVDRDRHAPSRAAFAADRGRGRGAAGACSARPGAGTDTTSGARSRSAPAAFARTGVARRASAAGRVVRGWPAWPFSSGRAPPTIAPWRSTTSSPGARQRQESSAAGPSPLSGAEAHDHPLRGLLPRRVRSIRTSSSPKREPRVGRKERGDVQPGRGAIAVGEQAAAVAQYEVERPARVELEEPLVQRAGVGLADRSPPAGGDAPQQDAEDRARCPSRRSARTAGRGPRRGGTRGCRRARSSTRVRPSPARRAACSRRCSIPRWPCGRAGRRARTRGAPTP